MSLYEASVPVFKKLLTNLDAWFDKAEAHAKSRNFDPAILLSARLAPDQFPLIRQVFIAADAAKLASSRLTGKPAPSNDDKETTIPELRARIQSTIAFLDTLTAKDFEGAETRKVVVPNVPGKFAYGKDHLFEHALPTFFFHVTTTYAILRHNGVDVGKRDFLGEKTLHDA